MKMKPQHKALKKAALKMLEDLPVDMDAKDIKIMHLIFEFSDEDLTARADLEDEVDDEEDEEEYDHDHDEEDKE